MKLLGKSQILLALVVLWAGCREIESSSSASVADKEPGQRVTLAWDYPVENEPSIQGFLLKQASSPEGPFRSKAKIERSQRQVEFSVSFESGTTKSFYVVVALIDSKETAATNVVEIRKKKSSGNRASNKHANE
jgi:hypothetical protein